jgi:molybdopterin-guanine dinucleotide biosynthesis protein A
MPEVDHNAGMTLPQPALQDITGLILCGGRGSRMGGVDKGLQLHQGLALVEHALRRLQPQVGRLMISANRNLGTYRALGHPVWPDPLADYAGPLAGWLAGLEHCRTPYLLTVPCDTPHFPPDLASRLATALQQADADIAMAATHEEGRMQAQPVFCLLKTTLRDSLVAYLKSGERKIDRWTALHRCTQVLFEPASQFANANTAAELQRLPPAAA